MTFVPPNRRDFFLFYARILPGKYIYENEPAGADDQLRGKSRLGHLQAQCYTVSNSIT